MYPFLLSPLPRNNHWYRFTEILLCKECPLRHLLDELAPCFHSFRRFKNPPSGSWKINGILIKVYFLHWNLLDFHVFKASSITGNGEVSPFRGVILFSCTATKSHLCIPFLGIAWPQSQFPRSSVCERFTFSQDRSTYIYFLQQNRQMGDCGRAIPFLGIFTVFRIFCIASL